MKSLEKSQLIRNISHFKLDSRIGKMLLSIKGSGIRFGERVSPKPGFSPEIIDYRHYRQGDPIKDIDWKISARQEGLLVKIREGFSQTDFIIAIDGSRSMRTTYLDSKEALLTNNKALNNDNLQDAVSKFTTALTLTYLAARIALKSRDRVYILWGDEKIRLDSEPMLLTTLLDIESNDKDFDFWSHEIQPGANLFIFSDFLVETEKFQNYLENLSGFSKNLFAISIHDPTEENFDFNGSYKFIDPENSISPKNRETIEPDFIIGRSADIKEKYLLLYKKHYQEISNICRIFGVKKGKTKTKEDPFLAFIRVVS